MNLFSNQYHHHEIHHHHYHQTFMYSFSNTYFKEAGSPTFVFKHTEPKNHTDEGSLSENQVVAPISSLNLSYN